MIVLRAAAFKILSSLNYISVSNTSTKYISLLVIRSHKDVRKCFFWPDSSEGYT